MQNRFNWAKGFSLIEVLLAVGVFAVAVLGLVGLLGPLLSDLRTAREEARAEEIMAAVQSELRTRSQRGEFTFEGPPPVFTWLYFRIMDEGGDEQARFLDQATAATFMLTEGERYASDTFFIRAEPQSQDSAPGGQTAYWAWTVEVRQWPAPSPDTPLAWPDGRSATLSPTFVFPAIARP